MGERRRPHTHSAPRRDSGATVQAILEELNQLLSQPEDNNEEVVQRMREYLPLVLDQYCTPRKAGPKQMQSVQRMLRLVVERYPGVFNHGADGSAVQVWGKLLPLALDATLRGSLPPIREMLLMIYGLYATAGGEAARSHQQALLADTQDLLHDLSMCADLLGAAGTGRDPGRPAVEIGCYQTAMRPEAERHFETAPFDVGGLAVPLGTSEDWSFACASAASLLAGMLELPCSGASQAGIVQALVGLLPHRIPGLLATAARVLEGLFASLGDCGTLPVDLLHETVLKAALAGPPGDVPCAAKALALLRPHMDWIAPYQTVRLTLDALKARGSGGALHETLLGYLSDGLDASPVSSSAIALGLIELLAAGRRGDGLDRCLQKAFRTALEHGVGVPLMGAFLSTWKLESKLEHQSMLISQAWNLMAAFQEPENFRSVEHLHAGCRAATLLAFTSREFCTHAKTLGLLEKLSKACVGEKEIAASSVLNMMDLLSAITWGGAADVLNSRGYIAKELTKFAWKVATGKSASGSNACLKLGCIKIGSAAFLRTRDPDFLYAVSRAWGDPDESVRAMAAFCVPALEKAGAGFGGEFKRPLKASRLMQALFLNGIAWCDRLDDASVSNSERFLLHYAQACKVLPDGGPESPSGLVPACAHCLFASGPEEDQAMEDQRQLESMFGALSTVAQTVGSRAGDALGCDVLRMCLQYCHPSRAGDAGRDLLASCQDVLSEAVSLQEGTLLALLEGADRGGDEAVLREIHSLIDLLSVAAVAQEDLDMPRSSTLLYQVKNLLDPKGDGNELSFATSSLLLKTVAAIGERSTKKQTILVAMLVLVGSLDTEWLLRSVAAHGLTRILAKHGFKGDILPKHFPPLFYYIGKNLRERPQLVQEAAEVLFDSDAAELLRHALPASLPMMLQNRDDGLLSLFAQAFNLPDGVSQLICDNSHLLFSAIETADDPMTVIQYIESNADGAEFLPLLQTNLGQTLLDILWRAADGEEDAWMAEPVSLPAVDGARTKLQYILDVMKSSSSHGIDVPQFLHSRRMPPLLRKFGENLQVVNPSHAPRERQSGLEHVHTLRCLETVIQLVEQHIGEFAYDIMTLLHCGAKIKDTRTQKHTLIALHVLVQALAQWAQPVLKDLLNQIVVLALPFAEEGSHLACPFQEQIENLFTELFQRQAQYLGSSMTNVPPLPPRPFLSKINATLARAKGRLDERGQLGKLLENLKHDSLSVRYSTLGVLKEFLTREKAFIDHLFASDEPLDVRLRCSLVSALLKCCEAEMRTATSAKMALRCADCLGMIGAVDSSTVPEIGALISGKSALGDMQRLPLELIEVHLVRVRRTASTLEALDAATYGIQQILQHYGPLSNQHWGSKTGGLFGKLDRDVQEMVRPMQTSSYILKRYRPTEAIPSPIFGDKSLSYRRWLLTWSQQMIMEVPDTHYLKEVFVSCQGLFKHDLKTMLHILPYLVVTVLCSGKRRAQKDLRTEILQVLEQGTQQVEGFNSGEGVFSEQPARRSTTKSAAESAAAFEASDNASMADLCMQAVFMLLDTMEQFVLSKLAASDDEPDYAPDDSFTMTPEEMAGQVQKTLDSIPNTTLANAALQCGAHARALKHYEIHLRGRDFTAGLNPAALKPIESINDDSLSFLIEAYVALEEPDGLPGIIKLRATSSPTDQKFLAEKSGNWADALAMYEQDLQTSVFTTGVHGGAAEVFSNNQRGYMRCLLNIGHLKALETHVDGLLAAELDPVNKSHLATYGASAAWRLGEWDSLGGYVEEAMATNVRTEPGFAVRLGNILLSAGKGDTKGMVEGLRSARSALMDPLSAAAMESYGRAYPYLVKLHMLHEVESTYDAYRSVAATRDASPTALVSALEGLGWKERLLRTQQGIGTREPLLALRRSLCLLLCNIWQEQQHPHADQVFRGLQMLNGESLLLQASLCRSTGHLESASVSILQAIALEKPNPFHGKAIIEKAKLMWAMDKKTQAISELKAFDTSQGRADRRASGGTSSDTSNALLQLANWSSVTGHENAVQLVELYRRVTKLSPQWEKGYFHHAKYLDEVMHDAKERQRPNSEAQQSFAAGRAPAERCYLEYLPTVIKMYRESLKYGTRFLFQSLPRMMTLWYTFGFECSSSLHRRVAKNTVATVSRDITAHMKEARSSVPPHVWLAVLPQLISQILHPDRNVQAITKAIILRTLVAFPQQVMWALAAVLKSNIQNRRGVAREIISSASKQKTLSLATRDVLHRFESFVDQLKKLCNYDVGNKRQLSFKLSEASQLGALRRMLPINILVPVQAALTPSFSSGEGDNAGWSGEHVKPFSDTCAVTIQSLENQVDLLSSLQRPKKVTIVGSDGRKYIFLFKPKDDLRKDARLMEFASVMNRLLAKDSASRKRNLCLRTFAVVPLTEDCGMVEWVPNTTGLRHALESVYSAAGLFQHKDSRQKERTLKVIDKIYKSMRGDPAPHDGWFDKVLEMFPPMLHKWFLDRFPEPTSWFEARLKFSRSAAAWSMVGHILGLGDRHGENLLLDASSGDVVHVDFAMLFDKGLQLTKPEMVPFRLTQNMIDGCGLSGYEGVFRKTCEIVLQVSRENKETLMSVLDTFVNDPLVEWTSGARGGVNSLAHDALKRIESRLSGVVVGVGAAPSLPLSPEGQADRLIFEASNKANLAQMYIWWMPWF